MAWNPNSEQKAGQAGQGGGGTKQEVVASWEGRYNRYRYYSASHLNYSEVSYVVFHE